jgi:hypothetical protein
MKRPDPAVFHRLYGIRKQRTHYYDRDFVDYALMILLTALALTVSYGWGHAMSIAGLALCVFALVIFTIRHGVGLSVPIALRKPEEVLYTFVYKLQNLKPAYFLAVGVLLLENLLIAVTPNLSHHVELMRTVGLYLFYIHFISITVFRTASLIDHLAKKELVREVLMQTPWKRSITAKTNITLEIVHAYCTGLLTHIVLIAPWYLVITYSNFSLLFLAVVFPINIVIHLKWLKEANAWFYRDHWLGHNSEVEFLFLHGSHHDAIPSGLIAVSENGFLEGFMRHAVGWPNPFYTPVFSFLVYMFDIKNDIDLHQYIPGVYPKLSREAIELFQHSTHHYGPLEPYGFAFKLGEQSYAWMPDEMRNAVKLDEELGFKWDNPTFRKTLGLYDKYQK